jgi:protocatechuate 3,4-dioxygenase beta subunit
MSSPSSAGTRLRRIVALFGALVLLPLAVVLAAAPAQAAAFTAEGAVVDTFGDPLPGVTVDALTAPTFAAVATSTTTGTEGDYALPLTAGTYHLRFSKAGYDSTFLGGGTGVEVAVGSGGDITVDGEPAEDNVLDDVTLIGTATYAVTGTVRNAGSAALSGITVEAFAYGDDETPLDVSTTNGSGAYALDLPGGLYQVHFSDPGLTYLPAWYDGTGPDPTEISVTGAKALSPVTLAIPSPTSEFPIAGGVVDALGEPVNGVDVAVTGVGGSSDSGADTTKAVGDDQGVYSVSVRPGTYQVSFSKTGFVSKSYGGASASTVTVANNGTLSVAPVETLVANRLDDLTLASTPFAKAGRVTTTGGAGINGVTVRAFPEGSTDPEDVVDTDVTAGGGTYTLDLPVGTYDLQYADTDGAAPTYTSGSLATVQVAQGGALSVAGTPVADLPDVQLALSSAETPHPIVGSVVDATGAEVDGLTVTAVPQGSGEQGSDTTGADGGLGDHGRYRLQLKPGNYQVTIDGGSDWADATYVGGGTASALVTVQLNGTVLVNGIEALGGDLGSTEVVGTTKYGLSGAVKEGSTGLSGLTVKAYDEDEPTVVVAQATSGANGVWTLTGGQGLVVGTYVVELSGSTGGNSYDKTYFGGATPTPVTITQGGAATVDGSPLVPANTLPDVTVTRSSANTLHPVTGEVTDANGDALAGVAVTPSSGPTTTAATTGAEGGYTLQLKAGTYTLTYTRSGFTTTAYPGGGVSNQVTVDLDGTVRVGSIPVTELEPVSLDQSPGTASVKGRVVAASDPGTAGINGIKVELFAEGDTSVPAVKQTTTATASGVAGSWAVTALPIGTYTIRYSDVDGVDPSYIGTYQGGSDLASASEVKVGQANAVTIAGVPQVNGAVATTTMTASTANTAYPVNGTVTDTTGDPVQGATVTPSGGPTTTSATTDGDGAYQLQLKAGTYTLTYARSGFTSTTYPGGGDPTVTITVQSNGTVLAGSTVVPDGALEALSLVDATGTAAISGRATNGSSGLTGITVELFPAGDFTAESRVASTTSGANGAWSFGALKIGEYDVRFSGASGGQTYVTTYYGGATTTSTTPIKVGQGDVVSVDGATKVNGAVGDTVLTATTGSTTYALTGSVTDANDEPLVGATARAVAISGGATATTATTDSEGAYSLALTRGIYEVRFEKTGFTTAYYLNAEGGHARVEVAEGGGTTIDGDEVVGNELDASSLIGTTMYSIAGTATNAGASPVPGITVTATPDAEGNPTRTTTTAANGTFTLTAPVGSYQIRFNDNRSGSPSPRYQVTYYGDAGTRVRVTAAGLVHVNPDSTEHAIAGLGSVTLPVADTNTTYRLDGTTYDPDFDPLAGVRVTAVPVAGTASGNATTTTSDGDGNYTLEVRAGKYRLKYTKIGYQTTFLTGDDPAVPLTVVVSATGVFSAPGYPDFATPVEVQLLFPAAAFKATPKLTGKVAVGQTVTTSFGTLQGASIDKDYVLVEWFLDGRAADDYSAGNFSERFKVPAVAATKKLTYRITIDDPDGLRASTVFNSPAVTVPKAPATLKGLFKKGKLTVTLTVPGLPKPTGVIVVKDGKKAVATIKLKAKSKGKGVVTLSKLKPGKHTLTLSYAGSKTINAATAKVKVVVKK